MKFYERGLVVVLMHPTRITHSNDELCELIDCEEYSELQGN